MAIIIPAILSDSKEDTIKKIKSLPKTEIFSIDIMDNTLTDTYSYQDPTSLEETNPEIAIELDIMSENPLPIIKSWAKNLRTVRVIIHAEINKDIRELLRKIHDLKLEAGIAILPQTKIQDIEHLLNETDMVLIRGNQPGYSGKKLLESTYKKIETLHYQYPDMPINIDIGVNKETIPKLVKAGATYLSVNSAIFKTKDPEKALNELKNLAIE